MNRKQALEAIKQTGHLSADFYIMQQDGEVLLMPTDSPAAICLDVVRSGSESQIDTYEALKANGNIVVTGAREPKTIKEVNVLVRNLDTWEISEDMEFSTHFLLQAFFPDAYLATFNSLFTTMSEYEKVVQYCWEQIAKQNEIPEDINKTRSYTTTRKPVGSGSSSYQQWIAACNEYKTILANAWEAYIQYCDFRTAEKERMRLWKRQQREQFSAWMKEKEGEMEAYLSQMADEVARLKEVHANIKAQGKPKKVDFK